MFDKNEVDSVGSIIDMQSKTKHLNLEIFKVYHCTLSTQHNYKSCPYFHNQKDRRRDLSQIHYSADFCPNLMSKGVRNCSRGPSCPYSHNKVEQAYHPEKYRHKFCVMYPNEIEKCPFGEFCSYAHSEEEARVELIHNYAKDRDFFMFHFKTSFCPFSAVHDRGRCAYAHNWQDYRRPPTEYFYLPKECPHWDQKKFVSDYSAACPQSYQCEYCHGMRPLKI